ncbi:MAG TPA: VTT domain-containing protein [Candidatus Paceibacterota bacterium]|nr:VTT domain-containing protein [Candidatus Paceibacterota bacterium]
MSTVFTNIGLLAGQNKFLAYFIIYLVTIFFGNISAFASFWLVLRGTFGPWGVPFLILTLIASDITADLLWYSLGRTVRDTRFGNFIKKHLPHHKKIEAHIRKDSTKWVFLSKFIYLSSFPIIFLVGWMRVGFRKFSRASAASILIWIPVLSLLAYGLVSWLTPLAAVTLFKHFELEFFIGLILFIAIDYLAIAAVRKFMGKRMEDDEETA